MKKYDMTYTGIFVGNHGCSSCDQKCRVFQVVGGHYFCEKCFKEKDLFKELKILSYKRNTMACDDCFEEMKFENAIYVNDSEKRSFFLCRNCFDKLPQKIEKIIESNNRRSTQILVFDI